MEYPVNPYDKDSQPLSHHLQERKNWQAFIDSALAPINEAGASTAQQSVAGLPFAPSPAAARRSTGPQMTREEVAALMAAPLDAAQKAHVAEADARVAAVRRRQRRARLLGVAVLFVAGLAWFLH